MNPAWKQVVIESLGVVHNPEELLKLREMYTEVIQYHSDILHAIDEKLEKLGVNVNAVQRREKAEEDRPEELRDATEKDESP